MRREGSELWQETVRRRLLTAEELAAVRQQLQSDPASREILDEEQALNRLLGGLADAPVPSNFTARVLAALDRESPVAGTRRPWAWELRSLFAGRVLPRWALAATVVLLFGGGSWSWHLASRARVAASLASITGPVLVAGRATDLSPVEMLQDFEVINHLRRLTAQPDLELLQSLQDTAGLQ